MVHPRNVALSVRLRVNVGNYRNSSLPYRNQQLPLRFGEVLELLENWRGASFADLIQQTGFGEPGKGAPHGDENTCFAAHA